MEVEQAVVLDPGTTRQGPEPDLVGAMIATRKALPWMLKQGRDYITDIRSDD